MNYQFNLSDLTSNNNILVEHQLKQKINDNINIVPSCIDISRYNNNFTCTFLANLNYQEELELNSIINTFVSYSESEFKKDSDNKLIVALDKKNYGVGYIQITQDFCKKETWYQSSIQKTNILLNKINTNLYKFPINKYDILERLNNNFYNIGDKYIIPEFKYIYYECIEQGTTSNELGYIPIYKDIEYIDGTAKFICKEIEEVIINVEYGKIFNEYQLNYYKTKIYKNNILLTSSSLYRFIEFKRAIDNGQSLYIALNILDGDYCIDYDNQIVYFKDDILEYDIIKSDYFIATTSDFILTKINGYTTKLVKAEAQFDSNSKVRDSLQLYFLYNNIPLKYNEYKTFKNFIDESNYSYPRIEYKKDNDILQNNSYTETIKDITIFFWDYMTNSFLDSNSMIKLKLGSDIPYFGEYATISFYFELENE